MNNPSHSSLQPGTVTMDALQSDTFALHAFRSLHADAIAASAYGAAARVSAAARQAISFDSVASNADLTVEPLLRYYALLHGTKAVLHLLDPGFPSSSRMLQHGLSTRRLKRDAYRWPLDAIHVYKEGILQQFATITTNQTTLPDRFIIGQVLGTLPSALGILSTVYPEFVAVFPVQPARARPWSLVSRDIASSQDLTPEEWTQQYQLAFPSTVDTVKVNPSDHPSPRDDSPGHLTIPSPPRFHPWARSSPSVTCLTPMSACPEWMAHYVLLYSLSTICRYNPVEWSDMMFWQSDVDAILVRSYLDVFQETSVFSAMLSAAFGVTE